MRILITALLLLTGVAYGQSFDIPRSPDFDIPRAPQLSEKEKEYSNRKGSLDKFDQAQGRGVTESQLNRVKEQMRGRLRTMWNTAYSMTPDAVTYNELALSEPFRAVAEVRVPQNSDQRRNQLKELEFFASRGFDTITVVWQGEQIYKIEALIDSLKSDWNIILTHGPAERGGTAYVALAKLRKLLRVVAQDVDALLPTWRHASHPHYRTDVEGNKRVSVLGGLAQNINPDLPIIGEIYMDTEPMTAEAEGIAGAVLQNTGTLQAMENRMLERAKSKIDTEIIPAIVGGNYYYDRDEYTQQELWNMKTTCADNYIKAGARGVIVLVGNGAGFQGTNKPALTKSNWRSLK